MTRLTPRQYGRRTMTAMVVYVALMLLVWPGIRRVADLPSKTLLALVPVLPMLYLIWLMARRILQSDELEQRTHLIGLGAATGASAAFSLVCGFLAAARVFELDTVAMLLFWVFPLQMFCYGGVRWWAARRYGSDPGCVGEEDGIPHYLRLLLAGMLIAISAAWGYVHGMDAMGLGLLTGISAALIAFAIVYSLRHRRRRGRPTDA
jgi:hypothetical protein